MSLFNRLFGEKKNTIYAFLIRIDTGYHDHPGATRSILRIKDAKEKMKNFLRERTGKPSAIVKIFEHSEWNAPPLKSIDQSEIEQNFRLIQERIGKVLKDNGVPQEKLEILTRELEGAPNPIFNIVTFWVVY